VPTSNRNPFNPGQWVCYTPTSRGRGLNAMTDLSALVPGQRYRIARVVDASYVVLEGFETSPTGGLHWSEFSAAE